MTDDSYTRFSRVAEDYARYRPHYPRGVVDFLKTACGLTREQVVADVGSGTGILTELFLQNGNRVYGVEPNDEMRSAAEYQLRAYPSFTSVAATAEETTQPDHSVNMITVGQAFHWFKHDLARQEFSRVLVPGGWVVLVWNLELNSGSPFAMAYEQLWHKYLRAAASFSRDRKRPDYVTNFFGEEHINEKSLDNYQISDFETFRGRVLSSSYSPPKDDSRYPVMLGEIKSMFDQYNEDGKVTVEYETIIVYGQLFG